LQDYLDIQLFWKKSTKTMLTLVGRRPLQLEFIKESFFSFFNIKIDYQNTYSFEENIIQGVHNSWSKCDMKMLMKLNFSEWNASSFIQLFDLLLNSASIDIRVPYTYFQPLLIYHTF
jgi:hypothetical protein